MTNIWLKRRKQRLEAEKAEKISSIVKALINKKLMDLARLKSLAFPWRKP